MGHLLSKKIERKSSVIQELVVELSDLELSFLLLLRLGSELPNLHFTDLVGECFHRVFWPGLGLVGVHVEVSGSRPIFRRQIIVGSRCRVSAEFFDLAKSIL